MPKYSYTAKSLSGEPREGTLEAKDEHQLARSLRQEGYVLIQAVLEEEKAQKRKLKISLPFLGKVKLTEKMMLTRNLKVMLTAGIPLPQSLQNLAGLTKSKKLKAALLDIMDEVIKGKNFSDSLARHPDIFSELFVSMVKVGEEAGTLEEVLKILTEQMGREHELNSKIMGALIYPAVIICAMLGIGFLMLVMVVPKLAAAFAELDVQLPLSTLFVIWMGNFATHYWYLLPIILLVLWVLFWKIIKTKVGKKIIDTLTLKVPIISSIVKKTNSAYTARTLSSLIASGVPIVRSLEVLSRTLGNIFYKKAVAEAAEKVRKGGKLAEALKEYGNIYPFLVIQMIRVGEETGQTSDILAQLADFYEEEVATTTKNLSSIIEPIIMTFIGGAVGFFAISMIQPMYSMLGAL